MRVALLAPISHPLPPPGYGPWEQVVTDLARGLTGLGVDVTVFAAAGSRVAGRLHPTVPHPLQEWPEGDDTPRDPRIWEEIHIAEMAAETRRGSFDVVHSHLSVHPLGYAQFLAVPLVTTLHGVAWNRATHPALSRYRHLPYVSLSLAERTYFPGLNYVATVHNGIDPDAFPMGEGGSHLLFVGRLAPEKAPHLAIEVAERSGRELVIAGPVEDKHRDYYSAEVAPRLRPGRIDHVGVLTRRQLAPLYREASALVVPLGWDEPFGLVVAEALMSGTPVIGWRRGALPELVEDGQTGFLVGDVAEAVAALDRLHGLSRRRCRADAEQRLSVRGMASGYREVYRSVSGLTPG